MAQEYSHESESLPPTPYASTSRNDLGEWDSPHHHRRQQSISSSTSTSTRGGGGTPSTRTRTSQVLTRQPDYKPTYSKYKQEILSEEEYITHLSNIIKRDFFPQLDSLDRRNELISAFESKDHDRIRESVRRMREIVTPTPRRRARASDTPGRTPLDSHSFDLTPTSFDRTPMTSSTSSLTPRHSSSYQPDSLTSSLSLDAFQSRYTSEDNSSFSVLLSRDNEARREKTRWAWQAEKRANEKEVRGRKARERLVDVTRELVEGSKDGSVLMLEGEAGRPGERKLLVGNGVDLGGVRGLMRGRNEGERLRITGGLLQGDQKLLLGREGEGDGKGKGKGKEVVRIDEGAKQFVDWDRPAVEEEQEELGGGAGIAVQGSRFKNRNSLMFPPDADTDPSDAPSLQAPIASTSALPLGDPKGIRYHATRLMEVEKGGRDGMSEGGTPSPSRSRINAAISGTPYPAPISNTPRVNDFSFVSAIPSPRASQLPPQALQELMTWGSIEATPVTLRSSTLDGDGSVGPFRIEDTSKREELAFKMARKAKRSLAESASGGKGLATDARRSGGSGGGLRRSAIMESSIRGSRTTPRTTNGASTPRTGDHLSPAARSLLGKTKPGMALEMGLKRSSGHLKYEEEVEEKRRIERAKKRAREVESRDRLKRERWTPSPAISLGFDPDLEDQGFLPKHQKMG